MGTWTTSSFPGARAWLGPRRHPALESCLVSFICESRGRERIIGKDSRSFWAWSKAPSWRALPVFFYGSFPHLSSLLPTLPSLEYRLPRPRFFLLSSLVYLQPALPMPASWITSFGDWARFLLNVEFGGRNHSWTQLRSCPLFLLKKNNKIKQKSLSLSLLTVRPSFPCHSLALLVCARVPSKRNLGSL